MMSLGQVAGATTAHLGTQAAPRQGRPRLPQTRHFMVPVALLAKSATFQASVQPCWQARALEVHCLALSAAPHWWLRRIDREPYRARIEVSRKAPALTLIARTTYIISQ